MLLSQSAFSQTNIVDLGTLGGMYSQTFGINDEAQWWAIAVSPRTSG